MISSEQMNEQKWLIEKHEKNVWYLARGGDRSIRSLQGTKEEFNWVSTSLQSIS